MVFKLHIFIFLIAFVSFYNPAASDGSTDKDYEIIKCDRKELFPRAPCCGNTKTFLGRVANANNTIFHEFPWMVHFDYAYKDKKNRNKKRKYAGTLINSRWVLTSARNLENRTITKNLILGNRDVSHKSECLGYYCKPNRLAMAYDKIFIHEKYNGNENDIALIRLKDSKFQYNDFVRPICLPLNSPKRKDFDNKIALVSGWGNTNTNHRSVLAKASVTVSDKKRCKEKLSSNQICAVAEGKAKVAEGDKGGPLFIELPGKGNDVASYYQIGVISDQKKGNIISTYIPDYIEWIKEIITNNS